MEDKNKNLLDEDFRKKIEAEIERVVNSDDQKSAKNFLELLEPKVFLLFKKEPSTSKRIIDFYQNLFVKLKYIALPLLSEQEVSDLLKNNFSKHFDLEFYDLQSKLKSKIFNIEVDYEKDVFKVSLKKILEESSEIITSNFSLKTVGDWIKNYNSKLGLEPAESLKRSQYFVDLRRVKNLDDKTRMKLKTLFDLYEGLKFTSFSPQGFMEEVPMRIDGRDYIFKQGELEPLPKVNIDPRIISIFGQIESAPASVVAPKPKASSLEPSQPQDLRTIANQYPVGSLERKAIEEEIRKSGN